MCEFSCPEGSRLVGSKIITCNSYGNSLQWSGNPPRCEPVCVKLTAGEFEMSCTNENFLNSRCTFRIGFFIQLKSLHCSFFMKSTHIVKNYLLQNMFQEFKRQMSEFSRSKFFYPSRSYSQLLEFILQSVSTITTKNKSKRIKGPHFWPSLSILLHLL